MKFFGAKEKLKILFVSSEEAPFAKVGGLGEAIFSLPRMLAHFGHDARVMIPCYGTIDFGIYHAPHVYKDLNVPTTPEKKGKMLVCNIRKYESPKLDKSPVTTYFLENREYYELRSNIYGYADDRVRFALLSRGCLEFLNSSQEWIPDIIVGTDWMTGYLPNFLKTDYCDYNRLKNIATVFSIHNLSSQGTMRPHQFLAEKERDDGYGSIPDFFSQRMQNINAMKRGIMYADAVNTVSPTYAEEITTEEYGEGLDSLLREKRRRLYGILNGIDYETNDPATDSALAQKFTSRTLHLREENKTALQKRFGLPSVNQKTFVIGIISRLTRQKGFILMQPIIEQFLKETESQLVVVGTGDTEIMEFFQNLQNTFPKQIGLNLQFDETIPHLLYAGCDVILIPSKFEPSGLTQMEAMRFGAVPVARKTGGLADTIEDYVPGTDDGTGFLFNDFDSTSLLIALVRAFVNWKHPSSWRKLQKRVMKKDFSWNRSARAYIDLFEKARNFHKE